MVINSTFCGRLSFHAFVHNKPGECFIEAAFLIPIFILLIISSIVYSVIAFKSSAFGSPFHCVFWLRIFCGVSLSFIHLLMVCIDALYLVSIRPIPAVHNVHYALGILAWSCVSVFNYLHSKSHKYSSRGPLFPILLVIAYFYASAANYWAASDGADDKLIPKIYRIINLVTTLIHLLSHAFVIYPTESHRRRHISRSVNSVESDSRWNQTIRSVFSSREVAEDERALNEDLGSISEINNSSLSTRILPRIFLQDDEDDGYLGDLEGRASWCSRFSFHWVSKLIRKGFYGEIRYLSDLISLPDRLNVTELEKKLSVACYFEHEDLSDNEPSDNAVILSKSLFKAYGKSYLLIGVLKFFGDAFLLLSPVFLNMLVSFVEDSSNHRLYEGILYAIALFVSCLLAALFSIHYSYQVNIICIKLQSSLVTAVYKKCLSLSLASLNRYSTGKIINMFTTDIERVFNFCNSFHEFWSMPLQVIVGVVLLYQQLQLASLTGLLFLLLFTPINKIIANKIGQLSSRMMDRKDARIKLMSEVLLGIRSVKMMAWERILAKRINSIRQEELSALKGQKYLDAVCVFLWAGLPSIIAFSTFGTYSLLGYKLTASKVFTSIALFGILIKPMNAFPWVINGLIEAHISAGRIGGYLTLPQRQPLPSLDVLQYENVSILVKSASFSWKKLIGADSFVLRDISLQINRGDFVGILGEVGSGKSSLLLSLMGELRLLSGQCMVESNLCRIAYVGQEAWLLRGTVRDNILLGSPYEADWYKTVVVACAMESDLNCMPQGDMTQVGEKGLTLSGGQRARLSLAQAVYKRADVYLLDDPLAAVDAKVGHHLMRECLLGVLSGRTRVLVTHHAHLMGIRAESPHTEEEPFMNRICLMENGRILEQYLPGSDEPMGSRMVNFIRTAYSGGNVQEENCDKEVEECRANLKQEIEDDPREVEVVLQQEDRDVNQLTLVERMERGQLNSKVYLTYLYAMGLCLSILILISLFGMQASRNLSDWWLAFWIRNSTQISRNVSLEEGNLFQLFAQQFLNSFHPDQFEYPVVASSPNHTAPPHTVSWMEDRVQFYLMVYGSIVGANVLLTFIRAFLFAYGGITAARVIHNKLLNNVLKATVSLFDQTPAGRLLNRFSSDLNTIDDSLPFILNILLAMVFGVLGSLAIVVYSLPAILLLISPMLLVYWSLQTHYREASRELKRINSVARSPLYSHLSESLEGVCIIRGLDQEGRFSKITRTHLTNFLTSSFNSQAAGAWLSMRLQMLGVILVGGVAVMTVLGEYWKLVEVSMAGLAMAYTLSITASMSQLVEYVTNTEMELVAVERAKEYIDNVSVERDTALHVSLPSRWPSRGELIFNAVSLRYYAAQSLALHKINLSVMPGTKLGVIGRTGSGKSSLFRALFRLVKHSAYPVENNKLNVGWSGIITLDGIDVANILLNELRSRIAIIPQEPFLFSGTLRDNLDPEGLYTDARLYSVLDKCRLTSLSQDVLVPPVNTLLDFNVGERGRHLSAGQRQLVCLARAMLIETRLICLDEATSSVDLRSEDLIQNTLSTYFSDATIVMIAHRLRTVTEFCDRVIVLQRGSIIEDGSPRTLLTYPHSHLVRMIADSK